MGLDLTLCVLTRWFETGDEVGYIEHVLRMNRDSDLFAKILRIPGRIACPRVQMPRVSWCTYADGSRPADHADRELGYLDRDPYGSVLTACTGRELGVLAEAEGFNGATLRFVGEMFAARHIVLLWH